LIEPIVSQINHVPLGAVASNVAPTLASMTALATDSLWKTILTPLLHRSRDDLPQVRLASWTIMMEVWKKMGEELLPMLPDIVPFLVEAWEDDDLKVSRLAKQVGLTIQDYLGEDLMDYLDK
jgi:U3 small nucleolar RNA-associated protein 10